MSGSVILKRICLFVWKVNVLHGVLWLFISVAETSDVS